MWGSSTARMGLPCFSHQRSQARVTWARSTSAEATGRTAPRSQLRARVEPMTSQPSPGVMTSRLPARSRVSSRCRPSFHRTCSMGHGVTLGAHSSSVASLSRRATARPRSTKSSTSRESTSSGSQSHQRSSTWSAIEAARRWSPRFEGSKVSGMPERPMNPSTMLARMPGILLSRPKSRASWADMEKSPRSWASSALWTSSGVQKFARCEPAASISLAKYQELSRGAGISRWGREGTGQGRHRPGSGRPASARRGRRQGRQRRRQRHPLRR